MDKTFDFTKAKSASEIPALKKLQETARRTIAKTEIIDNEFVNLFENDVIEAIKKHADRPQDIAHMNAVLRALLNTIPTTPST